MGQIHSRNYFIIHQFVITRGNTGLGVKNLYLAVAVISTGLGKVGKHVSVWFRLLN
jgi:hypothetical protein